MKYDAIIIGGGFYGCCLSLYLRRQSMTVLVLEQEDDLLLRASRCNQARVHTGFHYPRSITTALRSLVNLPRFVFEFRKAIKSDFTMLYGIAKHHSKVNAAQFYNLFKKIHAPIKQASREERALFNMELIEDVFAVKEYAFDCNMLRAILRKKMECAGVHYQLGAQVERIVRSKERLMAESNHSSWDASRIINCTYAGNNFLLSNSSLPLLPYKHELTEVALIQPPRELANVGITVMDGPFFSAMPYPGAGCWSLTHVRYTPHGNWQDSEPCANPYAILQKELPRTKYPLMAHDAARYVPTLASATYVDSLFEIKTLLVRNDDDDGRPIFLYTHSEMPGLYSVLGSKLDTIYDLFDAFHIGSSQLK